MNMYAERLLEFFSSNVTEDAANEIIALEAQLDEANDIIRRCKIVMECNDPTNYRLIFEGKK